MANDWLSTYRYWLAAMKDADAKYEKQLMDESISETLENSSAKQEDATVNGVPQPIIATRKETNKASVTLLPGDGMNIGDLVYVFKEYWICMELYTDEYGITYAEIWMCNWLIRYQDHALNIIEKYAIMDNGLYSRADGKAIPVTDNYFTCYVSMDEESDALFVDKRLAIDTILDSQGNPILEVGKIVWLDTKSRNFGEGSHLLMFGLEDDLYNKENDSLEYLICDYREKDGEDGEPEEGGEEPAPPEEPDEPTPGGEGYLYIEGRDTIRIGTSRTYSVKAVDPDGNTIEISTGVTWDAPGLPSGVSITPSGTDLLLTIPLDDDLVGGVISMTCSDDGGAYASAKKEVEVITVG